MQPAVRVFWNRLRRRLEHNGSYSQELSLAFDPHTRSAFAIPGKRPCPFHRIVNRFAGCSQREAGAECVRRTDECVDKRIHMHALARRGVSVFGNVLDDQASSRMPRFDRSA